jgi:phosphoglycolate phosphatase
MLFRRKGNSALVVFDLDGTLIDSRLEISEGTNATRSEYGLSEASAEDLGLWFGKHPRNFFSELDEEDLSDAIVSFRRIIFESKSDPILFSDAFPALEAIKTCGYDIGVATTKSTELAKHVLDKTELRSLVDQIQGTDGIPEKPAPDVFFLLEKKFSSPLFFKANYETKISVGDRVSDIIAGNAAEYESYGILRKGSHESREDFMVSGATGVLESLMQLPIIRGTDRI